MAVPQGSSTRSYLYGTIYSFPGNVEIAETNDVEIEFGIH